jgi:DNA-binding response OmpR family regulator
MTVLPMTVLLVSSDLMSASRVEGAVRQAGANLRQVGSVAAAVDFCANETVPLVLVDLATAGLNVSELVAGLRSNAERSPAIVAYGPHVHEALLKAAQKLGCDVVLSRGQFMSQATAIVAQFV